MSVSEIRYFLTEQARASGVVFKAPRPGDAGFDLPASVDVTITPNGMQLIPTGLHLAIPEGWVGLVRDRSSVALRGGATTAGVIDSSYRGEVKVVVHNLGIEPLMFKAGERIAQLLIVAHHRGEKLTEVADLEALGSSERKEGGFGSTGR